MADPEFAPDALVGSSSAHDLRRVPLVELADSEQLVVAGEIVVHRVYLDAG
eukprot:COSAG02_NODE_1662_length_11443_cov_3.729020_3_plen_51_part_00